MPVLPLDSLSSKITENSGITRREEKNFCLNSGLKKNSSITLTSRVCALNYRIQSRLELNRELRSQFFFSRLKTMLFFHTPRPLQGEKNEQSGRKLKQLLKLDYKAAAVVGRTEINDDALESTKSDSYALEGSLGKGAAKMYILGTCVTIWCESSPYQMEGQNREWQGFSTLPRDRRLKAPMLKIHRLGEWSNRTKKTSHLSKPAQVQCFAHIHAQNRDSTDSRDIGIIVV